MTDIPIQEYMNEVFEYFVKNNIDFMRAPYLGWAQLTYFSHPSIAVVNNIYGPNELLLFNTNHLITSMDFEVICSSYL